MAKALIVDDHPIARAGLRMLLESALQYEEIAEVDDAAKALDIAAALRPDLALLDLRVPGPLPISVLCSRLREMLPKTRVVIVTAFGEPAPIKACLASGAHGCLLKDTSEIDLADALRRIAGGDNVLDPRIAQSLAEDLVGELQGQATTVRLTARERDVLALLAEGCANKAIAERLALAETTVKGYVGNLLEKLGATSRLHAVVRASELGLL
ncbi:MAG: two-component system, NarL family, response regulator DevR [Solirubrobacteraceae bacterium]|nr:two-component system, NarL family, response regulator DevR [Solirubrobacteraceae bacterium]